jgi:D-hexose-6-phosphate mutarotase
MVRGGRTEPDHGFARRLPWRLLDRTETGCAVPISFPGSCPPCTAQKYSSSRCTMEDMKAFLLHASMVNNQLAQPISCHGVNGSS